MLRLRLLGSFELRGPGDKPVRITARKARALLAFLASLWTEQVRRATVGRVPS